jgi:hypothetical protein
MYSTLWTIKAVLRLMSYIPKGFKEELKKKRIYLVQIGAGIL